MGYSQNVLTLTQSSSCTAVEVVAKNVQRSCSSLRVPTTSPLIDRLPSWKWVFPTTKERYSTLFREEMNEWFDTMSLTDISRGEDLQVKGLFEALQYLWGIINKELESVPVERLVLGGISQGCATGLHTLLLGGRKLGAFIGISGWMPFAGHIEKIARDAGRRSFKEVLDFMRTKLSLDNPSYSDTLGAGSAVGTPVFLGHGLDDEVISIELGKQIHRVLSGLGVQVTWKEYQECGH
ncbi:MAG: hypothetical protein M1816_002625 [Peltula sp. TS41687]|nr:MAG: hypothetical protein M1816_002625 [Peltula sp. TS41687]